MRRDRSRKTRRRGVWRVGAAIGAIAYSLAVWAALFQGVPRVVAWIGERRAAAHERAHAPAPPPNTP